MDYFVHEKALVEAGAEIGDGTRLWAFVHVQAGARLGKDCNICNGCFIERGALVGHRVTLKHHVAVFEGVTLEDDVFVGSNVAFVNDQYPRSRAKDWVLAKTVIHQGASIGANATILGGVTIGAYAMVGAGSVVTSDVPAHALVMGVPGVIQGMVCDCGQRCEMEGAGVCACGRRYQRGHPV